MGEFAAQARHFMRWRNRQNAAVFDQGVYAGIEDDITDHGIIKRIRRPHTPKHRAAISYGVRQARAAGKMKGNKEAHYVPPPEYAEMYDKIVSALSGDRVEAKRIMLDHIATMERRKNAQQR